MGDLVNIISIIKGAPTEFTLAISVFFAIVAIWLKSRDIDITAATSISRLQLEQVKSLMEQNKALAEDLNDIREKLSKTYIVVDKLRKQIEDLEGSLFEYKNKCNVCPGRRMTEDQKNVQ